MIAEYKCKISGDTSQLLKSIKEAKGELKQLNDDEVLIKLNYDGNLKEFNKVFDQVSKSNPQIAVQFQYDINKKILEEELDKLKDMSVELDTDNIKKQMKTLGQDILKINEEWIDDIEDETDAYDRLIESTQNMLNLQKQLESSGEDGNKALSDLGNTIKEIITEVSKSEGLTGKIINTKNLDAQNQKIIYLKNTLAELKKQGAVDTTGQDFVQNANESIRALDKLKNSFDDSLVAEKLGEYWGEGYAQDILKHKDDVENAVRELVNSGIITAQQLLDDMPNIFGNIDYSDLINPVKNILSENFDSKGNALKVQVDESDISLGAESKIQDTKKELLDFYNKLPSVNNAVMDQLDDSINQLEQQIKSGELSAEQALDRLDKKVFEVIESMHEFEKIDLNTSFTHIGSSELNKDKYNNIINSKNPSTKNKPSGGFWASPSDNDEWEYIAEEEMGKSAEYLAERFTFKFKENAKVLIIKSLKDIENLPRIESYLDSEGKDNTSGRDSQGNILPDWEKISKYYDGILVKINESEDDLYNALYGWDIDSVVVTNPDAIEQIQLETSATLEDIQAKKELAEVEAERARAEMQAEETAYDARKKAEVEAERASQAIAEEQNKVQNEVKDTTTLLNDLKDLLQNLSENNLKAFEESHNGFFGINDDNFDQTFAKLRDIKEIITKLTGNDKTGNGSTLFGKSLLGEDKDGYDILSRKISSLEKLGYTVSEIRKNGMGGYAADIIPIPDKAIKNGEEMARILFDIEKYEQNIQSNETPVSTEENKDIVSKESLEKTESELNSVNEKLSITEAKLEESRNYTKQLEDQLASTTNQTKELADAMERIDRLQDQLQEERNYSSNAFDAQIVAETKNDELQKENDKLEEEIARLNNELANKQDIELSNKNVDVSVNEGLREEKQLLEDLGAELNNVIQKVQGKTNEFEVERATVLQVVDDEINSLKELESQLENIIKKASKIKIKIDVPENIDTNINLGIDKLDPQIAKLREAVENIQEILSVLRDFKLGDASKLGTLFKNLSSVEWSKIKIPKSFVENLGNLVTGTAYLDKDNLNKLKNFLNAIVKIDLSTVGENLNSVADGLASIINQIKDTDTISALSDLKDTIQVLNKTGKLKDINDKNKSKKESQKKITKDNQKIIDNFENQYSSIIRKLNVLRNDTTIKLNAEGYEKVRNNIDNLENEIESLSKIDTSSMTKEGIANIQLQIDIAKNSIKELKNEYKVANPAKVGNIIETLSTALQKNGKYSKDAQLQIRAYYNEILSTDGQISAKRLNEILAAFQRIDAAERDAGRAGESFGQGLSKRIKSVTQSAIAMSFSFYDIIRYARETIGVVTEIDSALTELRKVSDASTERLSQSFEKSADTAKDLGSTITDVINVTADWSRLGYDIDDAEELARVTTLFQNVGDNMTADDASSYLISTLQGFQMSADQSEEIVDRYNEVANNFAIDTAGIGEALQRSAASFNAANTDLSKSIALITATNEVVQNPETVGTLWKTKICLYVQKCA